MNRTITIETPCGCDAEVEYETDYRTTDNPNVTVPCVNVITATCPECGVALDEDDTTNRIAAELERTRD